MKNLIKRLVEVSGLSGHEEKVITIMKEEFNKYSDNVSVDNLGNVIAKIEGEDDSECSMIFAHMDQLGLVVRKIEDNGYIGVERLGGVPEKVLPATEVVIISDDGKEYPGTIANTSHHITPPSEKYRVSPYLELLIDIGANSKEEVKSLGIDVGCAITYKPNYRELMNDKIMGTSLDNRVGCAILVELAKEMKITKPKQTVYLVSTVMEEFNLRGAHVAARKIKPKIAICLDLVPSGDTPATNSRSDINLGGGPVLSMYNFHGRGTLNGTIPHPRLVDYFKNTARDNGISIQRGALTGLLTDLSYVQMENDGIASIDLAFPARYTHSPTEVVCLKDVLELKKWVFESVIRIDKNFNLGRV